MSWYAILAVGGLGAAVLLTAVAILLMATDFDDQPYRPGKKDYEDWREYLESKGERP